MAMGKPVGDTHQRPSPATARATAFPAVAARAIAGDFLNRHQMLRLSREHANNPLLKKVSVSIHYCHLFCSRKIE